jgi:hypothetical protein
MFGSIIDMALWVYIPKTIEDARKWIEIEKEYGDMNGFKYTIINGDFGSLPLEQLCVNPETLKDSKFVYFCYPENGKDPESIYKFVEYAVNLARQKAVYILTVSSWLVHFVNLFIYLGEFTKEERQEIMKKHNLNGYIRFDDVDIAVMQYNSDKDMCEFDKLPLLHRSPPQYDFVLTDNVTEWLTGLFIALDIAYDAKRRD